MLVHVTRELAGSFGVLMSITGALEELKFTHQSCLGLSNFDEKGEPITLTVRMLRQAVART
jgi:hypothetical protein